MTKSRFTRTIRLAAINFIGNGKRNALSIATVVLGSLAICAVFTVNDNVEVYVDSLISRSGGPNLFLSREPESNIFTANEIKNLKSLTSNRYVSVNGQVLASLRKGTSFHEVRLVAADSDYAKARPYLLLAGQFISPWDEEHPAKNIVLSPEAVSRLGLKQPLGQTVNLFFEGLDVVARVIGIAKPLFDTNDVGFAWVSPTFFMQLHGSDGFSNLILGFTSYSLLDSFEQKVRDSLVEQSTDLEIYNPRKYFEELKGEYGIFTQAGLVIGTLSLFAGAIGVMNMMMMGISLRSKEIGLYRALGFSKGVILLNFLSETLYIVGTGGLVGALMGSLLGLIISINIVDTPVFVSSKAFFLSLSISTLIGLLFAYFPAKKAASLTAVEALRK